MNLPKNPQVGPHCVTGYLKAAVAANSEENNFAQLQVHIKRKA